MSPKYSEEHSRRGAQTGIIDYRLRYTAVPARGAIRYNQYCKVMKPDYFFNRRDPNYYLGLIVTPSAQSVSSINHERERQVIGSMFSAQFFLYEYFQVNIGLSGTFWIMFQDF